MRKRMGKLLSVLLTLVMVVGLMPATAMAAEDYYGKLEATDASVTLDGTNPGTVTVSLVGKAYMDVYAIQAYWDTRVPEDTGKLILSEITTDISNMKFTGMNYVDAPTGTVMWSDDSFSAPAVVNDGTRFLNATYTVAADTPPGTYTVRLKNVCLTATDYNNYTDQIYWTATITVKAAEVAVEGVSLNKSETTLTEGATETLTATVEPVAATDKTVTWTSSDDSVATVVNGVVIAVKAGTATITAKAGDKTATCAVTVNAPVHEHTYAEAWTSDATHHWHAATCGHADEKSGYDEHDWNAGEVTTEPTEETEGVKTYTCEICEETKTESIPVLEHEHTYAEAWTSDATHHWHAATCGHTDEKSGYDEHDWDAGEVTTEPTEETEGVKTYTCEVCEGTKTESIPVTGGDTPSHEHVWDKENWKFNDTHHWIECIAEDCPDEDAKAEYGEHEFENDEDTDCDCGYVREIGGDDVVEHEHDWADDYSYNKTYHWFECEADGCDVTENSQKDGYEKHDFGGDRVCDDCGYRKPASSSSSSGSTKYKVTLEDTDNGSVESSRTKASKGTTVTITVDPEAGYEVDDIVVETKAGKEVEVTDKGEGKFTFKMPAANVTVSVDFAKADVEDGDAKDEVEYIQLTIDSVIAWVFDEFVANDVAPVIRNARTMLPARFVAEALGGVVTWDETEQKVTIVNGEDTIEIFIGEPFATVNGDPVELDSPAFIENDRTYLPIRFIAENMGATVTWDAAERTVTIVPGE